MSGLRRRVDVLVSAANEARMRGYRRFAADHGVPLEELLDEMEEEQTAINQLKAEGLSFDEILARRAQELGISLEELRAGCDDIGRRPFGG